MEIKYLNTAGLTHLWEKIKTLIATKAEAEHTHNYAGATSSGGAAVKAIADENGNNIATTYVTKAELEAALAALNLGFAYSEDENN